MVESSSKIDVTGDIAKLRNVLAGTTHGEERSYAIEILRRWQCDEMLTDESRTQAGLALKTYRGAQAR